MDQTWGPWGPIRGGSPCRDGHSHQHRSSRTERGPGLSRRREVIPSGAVPRALSFPTRNLRGSPGAIVTPKSQTRTPRPSPDGGPGRRTWGASGCPPAPRKAGLWGPCVTSVPEQRPRSGHRPSLPRDTRTALKSGLSYRQRDLPARTPLRVDSRTCSRSLRAPWGRGPGRAPRALSAGSVRHPGGGIRRAIAPQSLKAVTGPVRSRVPVGTWPFLPSGPEAPVMCCPDCLSRMRPSFGTVLGAVTSVSVRPMDAASSLGRTAGYRGLGLCRDPGSCGPRPPSPVSGGGPACLP